MRFGYCTNVHPGISLKSIQDRLLEFAVPVRKIVDASKLPVGLWINETALREFQLSGETARFANWMLEHNLSTGTLNGFPQGDFHQPVVKHDVYLPTWAESSRLEYTIGLADVLHGLSSKDQQFGTISTLPFGWGKQNGSKDFLELCQANLLMFAQHVTKLEERTGFCVRLCIEAEPGCFFGDNSELARFFENWLQQLDDSSRSQVQRHIAVCFDVCHAAVMFENIEKVCARFDELKIEVAKVQVSSALIADFDQPNVSPKLARRLSSFVEPRYLHQTKIRGNVLHDDLPIALATQPYAGTWGIHFHVPIFVAELPDGLLTSQEAIVETIRLLAARPNVDWEVETYAWTVLPEAMRPTCLSEGIAQELLWLESCWSEVVTTSQ